MRVLFVLEPVIFRDDPAALRAHFTWLDRFEAAVSVLQGKFAVAANAEVCRAWQQSAPGRLDEQLHVLDAFSVLADYGHERVRYAKATYSGDLGDTRDLGCSEDGCSAGALTRQLQAVRASFDPQLVVMSAQNALASRAFTGIRVIYIEQAALPRLGHPMRTMIDPRGHQRGSMLETEAEQIRSLSLSAPARADSDRLLGAIRRSLETHPLATDARQALAGSCGSDVRVALLATQPTDAVTYEGADAARALENTLYAWASALPPGWVAVPTYHAGQRLSPAMEAVLASACPRVRLLPASLSQGLTEVLLPHVDGLVTISSSTAMTALLLGKKVVVTGHSPYGAWCDSDPALLDDARPLTRNEAQSSLCFLTHRYAHANQRWVDHPQLLADLVQRMVTVVDPGAWQLDVSGWTLEQALTLFNFEFCVAPRGEPAAPCARRRLEREAAGERDRAEDLRVELERAVAAREQAERERADAMADLDSLRSEWTKAVAQRDRAESDLIVVRERLEKAELEQVARGDESADLERELASAKAQLRRLQCDSAAVEGERDEHARRAAVARLAVDETRRALADAQAQQVRLEEALSQQRSAMQQHHVTAEGELARLEAELAVARDAAAASAGAVEQSSAAAGLDALRDELVDSRTRCEHLRQKLMTLAPLLEAAHREALQRESERADLAAVAAERDRQLLAIRSECNARDSALQVLGAEHDRLTDKMMTLLAERDDLRDALADVEAKCERASLQSSASASRLEQAVAQRDESRAALGAERDRLGGEITALLAERDDLRAALATAKTECERANLQSIASASRLEDAAAQRDQAYAALSAADADCLHLQEALSAARADLTALSKTSAVLQDDHHALQRLNAALADTRAVLAEQIESARADGLTIKQELATSHDRQLTLQGLLDTAIGDANRAGSTLALAVRLHDAAHDEHLLAMATLYKALDGAIAEQQRLTADLLRADTLAEHLQQQARCADDRADASESEFDRLAMTLHASPVWRLATRWQQRSYDGGREKLQRRIRAVANAGHTR